MKYYIKQKDGHIYEFNNYRNIRVEYELNGDLEIIALEIQFKPRQRYKEIRIIGRTIIDSNISKIRNSMLVLTK